jgi:hypothetical protein
MIAGALPATTTSLSPGSGPVSIYNNLIQANLSNDDGGGIRFLMAGNFPMNVYNNFIVNNISTHEGGGVSINDAPNVRVFNNTIMKNLTTATAITSSGSPAPAGLSTSVNSALLQATLPTGSPTFSNPLLFNNIFWDNRAGSRAGSGVTGLTLADANYWDLGVADGAFSLSPTNSVIQQNAGTHPYATSPTNSAAAPSVVSNYDVAVTFNAWRNNPAFLGAILISADLPPTLMGNYHLAAANNLGAASKAVPSYQQAPATLAAPATDIDNQARTAPLDAGADEFGATAAASASLSPASLGFGDVLIGATSAAQTITLSNTGTAALNTINVAIVGPYARPAGTAGGTCGTTLAAGGLCTISVVFTPTAAGTAPGTVTVTGTVPIAGSPVALLGSGLAAPSLSLLDDFNRTALGTNWNVLSGFPITIFSSSEAQATTAAGGAAVWNLTRLGAKQAAAMTITNITSAPTSDYSLLLKVSGGTPTAPLNAIRVRYRNNNPGSDSVIVEWTTTGGGGGFSFTQAGTNIAQTFAVNDVLEAMVDATGLVTVWRNGAAIGTRQLPNAALWTTGDGYIGMTLTNGARADNFRGGTVAP